MKTHIFLPVLIVVLIIFGTACDDDADDRNKFVGRYEVTEYSLETYTQRDDYEVRIRKDAATEDMIIISNFYNHDIDAVATVQGNAVTIIKQEHNIFEFEGFGNLEGIVIIINYTVRSTLDGSEEYFDRLRAEMTLIE